MSDIKINGTTTNPNLPSALTTKQQIAALAGYKAWMRSQDGFMTPVASGGETFISQFQDYGGGIATFTSTETSPSYAKRVAGSIGGLEAAYFGDVVSPADPYDRYDGANFTFNWQQSWTIFGVAQADASLLSSVGTLVGLGSTGSDTKIFVGTSGTGNLQVAIGSSGTINAALDTNPFWFIASFYANGAASKLSFELNGVRGADVTRSPIAANTSIPNVGSFGNGQGWKGPIREMLYLQEPVHNGVANTAVRDLLRKHAQKVYGLA